MSETDELTNPSLDDSDDAASLEGSRAAVTKGLFLAALALAVIAAITIVVALNLDSGGARRPTATLSYVVPAGTGAQVDLGNARNDIFPEYLEVQVGDSIVIRNDDARSHVLGPFTVRAGETLTYEFQEVGTYRGACTVHGPGHEAIIRVLKSIPPTPA